METNYLIAIIGSVFTIFLVIKEWQRSDQSRLFLRILASVLMVISFALLIIPISYSTKKVASDQELNLLTEGTSLDTIKSIKNLKYDLDSTLFPDDKSLKISHLADLSYYLKAHPAIKKINIYGYGLSNDDLHRLKDYTISFHPSVAPSGIVSVNWPSKLNISGRLEIQGVYNNQTSSAIRLKLTGLGAQLDSLVIKPHTKVKFSLSDQPKQIGMAVYKLVALLDKDTLTSDPVPFEVEKKAPLSVLVLASSPDFEYKFLKKWLYENQYPVALRSKISKDKYSTEFLNRKIADLSQLNQALLKDIDLVIADEDELSPDIFSAVNKGMGLIVRTGKLPSKQDHQSLLKDEKGKSIAELRLSGMGKIISITVSSTYEWQLSGKQIEYSRFWSFLFEKASKKKPVDYALEIEPNRPKINEKARVIVSVSNNKAPIILVDSSKIAMRQNMELPFVWDGVFWATDLGWNTFFINQKLEYRYVYKKADWNTVKNYENLRATSNFINNIVNIGLKTTGIEYLMQEEVSKWWFFFFFLIAMSFLWYEKRFLAAK